jgi:uncharacterized SAM-binding protein YcdF (DUF218 family)
VSPFSGVQVLGKELRRDPNRALVELRARTAAATVCLRMGAEAVVSLEAPLRGQVMAGSEIVRLNLEQLGVRPEQMILDTLTRSTREEALVGARIAHERGWRRLLVITSSYHVPRARRCFEDVMGSGAVAVHTPEAMLQHAIALEREWIIEGSPENMDMLRECVVEAALSFAARLVGPLPPRLRWQAEVVAGNLLRGMDERSVSLRERLGRSDWTAGSTGLPR